MGNSPKTISQRNFAKLAKIHPPNAKALGLTQKWLDRMAREGLMYASKASMDNLQKLAEHYGVEIEDFFDESLCVERKQTIRRFTALLATGNHKYLADLIKDLFERSWRETIDIDQWIATFSSEAVMLASKTQDWECESYPDAVKLLKYLTDEPFTWSQFKELEDILEKADVELQSRNVKKSSGLHSRLKKSE